MCLRYGKNSHTKSYCKTCRVHRIHCKSQTHAFHCCAFIPGAFSTINNETSDTASIQKQATLSEANEEICHICPVSKRRRAQRIRKNLDRSNRHSSPRHNTTMLVPLQHQQMVEIQLLPTARTAAIFLPTSSIRWIPISTSTATSTDHCTKRSGYRSCTTADGPTPSATLSGKSRPDQSPREHCQFKDKDTCAEWLQRCKESNVHTGYNFRSALLQRSSKNVAKVIRSLDEDLMRI